MAEIVAKVEEVDKSRLSWFQQQANAVSANN